MKKAFMVLVILSMVGFVGCQRPKPQIILPQATEPVSTPTTAPTTASQVTETSLPASPTVTATPVATPTPSPTATPGVMTHTVSFGDTLFSLAQAYGVTVEAIAAANGLTYPYLIYVGQELVIPEAGAVTPVAGQVYVVQYGDTLFSIAQGYGTSVEALAQANGLTYPYIIYVGQTLLIP